MQRDIKERVGSYQILKAKMEAVLQGETNLISIMSTIAGMIKQEMESIYWVGFYIEDNGVLKVGPYQGTLGCLTIAHERGVCGRAYRTKETQIVDDVHLDPEHIACDPASVSEIVLPVCDKNGNVFAVLDVDSTIPGNFNTTDKQYLEDIINQFMEVHL